jgi:type IV pilus assembly protein PilY1
MKYSLPASPAIADTDNDGFIDTAYIGDIGGNMWRFKFCRQADSNCGIADWSGGLFFDSSSGNIRPIYTMAALAKDSVGNLWVYWGTGDKTDPTAANAQEHFYGVKDNDRTSTYTVSDIDNITTAAGTYSGDSSKVGYRIQLSGSGQKILADPTVFGGVVYFTTFTPASGSNPCEQGGMANLFAIKYATGGGALAGGARTMEIGAGIASAPVISLPPDSGPPDLYVTTSGGGGTSASTQRVDITPAGALNRTNMLYWRDQRIQ